MRPYTLLATALFVLLVKAVHGQTCPNQAQSAATIVTTEEQCFGANDGTIEISFVDATGVYDASLGSFEPGIGDYLYGLFDGGPEGGWVYDEANITPGDDVVASITVNYVAPNTITFTGLPPNRDIAGYRVYIFNSNCTPGGRREFAPALGAMVDPAPEIIIDPAQITTQANTVCTPPAPFDGEINMNSAVSGGAGGYEYSIDGTTFQTSPVFPNLEHGTYTVTVIDQNSTAVGDNCTKTVSVTVPDGRVPPTAAITPTNPEACASVDLPLNGSPSGGTGNYVSHVWTGDVGSLSATDVVDPTFNSATPGTYNLTYEVTDDKGCTATSSVTITVVDPIVVSLIVDEEDNTICAGEATNVIIRNAQAGYRYQLRIGTNPIGGPANGTDADLTLPTGNLTATTTFNVLVSSISGPCPDIELTDQATVNVVDAVDITLPVSAQDAAICSGDGTSILLENSESGVTYQLRNDADDSNVGAALTGNGGDLLFPVSPTATTTYNIVADNGVCSDAELTNQATVTVNPSPTQAVLSGDATVCAGSSTDLAVAITDGTGPFNFTIANSVDASTIPVTNYTNGNFISISPTADVTYTLSGVVTDANGCQTTGSGSATITLNQGPTAATITGDATICEGESANLQLAITGGLAPYQFTLSDGTAITGYTSGDNITVNPTSTTSYTAATVRDANNCEIAVSGSATITVNPRPTPFSAGPNPLALCPGDDATITLDGSQSGVTYEIYNNAAPTGQTVSGTGAPISLTLTNGSFANNDVLTVQANNGSCIAPMTGSATVSISTISTFGITSPASITACPGETVTISLGGSESGVTYELLVAGASTGTFVNGTGAAIDFTRAVTSSDNGQALSVIGRRGSCDQLMSGSTTVSVSNLTAEAGPPQTVPENTATVLSGSASGGTGPYTYVWTSSVANQIAPGEETNQNPNTVNLTTTTTFTLTVTDNAGCQSTDVITVTVTGGLPTVTASATPSAVCAGETVQLTATASGGTGSYTYTWDNGAGAGASPTVNPTVTTTYEVTVRDGNGATAQDQVIVTVNPLPDVHNVGPDPLLVCTGADAVVALDDQQTDVTYTLLRNNAATGVAPVSAGAGLQFTLPSGTFNHGDVLTIRAQHNPTGCLAMMNGSATIQTNDPQPFAVTAVDTDVCTGEDAVVRLSGSEVGVDYDVLMNGAVVATLAGDNNPLTIPIDFADLIDGGSVTIEADNGSCTVAMTGSATVSISAITTANAGPDETICSDGYLFSANSASTTETGVWTVESGTGTFVSANNPATVVNGLSVGDNVFKWTITDNNGVCSPTEDLIIITRKDVTTADAGTAQTVCIDEVILAANDPVAGEQGTWTTTGSGLFDDPNDPTTRVTNLDIGANEFVWTISDISGTCPANQATVTVTRNQLTADAGMDQSIPAGTTAPLSGSASNGTGPYVYQWEPAGLLDDPTIANPTTVALTASATFTLTVTDQGVGTTCQATDAVTITVTGGVPSVIASANGSDNTISICEGETVNLSALGSGGDGSYTYAWSSDNSTLITHPDLTKADATVTPSATTVFTVEITDGNNDTATDDIIVTVNPLPADFTLGNDPTLVCSSTDAVITLSGSEVNTNYRLLRNNTPTTLPMIAGDGNTLTITLLQSEVANGDVWTIRAESAAGCTRIMSGQVTIQINDPVTYAITTSPVLTVCQGQDATITLDGSDNGINYVLSTGGNSVATLTGTGVSLDFVLTSGSFADGDIYTLVADNGSCQVTMTGSVEIDMTNPVATFAYPSSTYCFDGTDPKPVPGYATGGTFSTTDPIDVHPDDGTIDVSASTVGGPYTIEYTIGSGSCVSTESFQVSIINSTPDPTFDYSQDQYCIQSGTVSADLAPGATAGTFSYTTSGSGTLTLAADGTIDLATSDPGTYRVANFIAGSGGSCTSITHEETVQIFESDVADISYNGGNPICQSDTDPTPVFAPGSTTTGTFTVTSASPATAVMTIVPTTGLIDLSDTDPGIYEIEFVTDGPCPDDITVTVEIEAATDTRFTYPASSFCVGTGSVLPDFIATNGGVFSSNLSDLLVDSGSGEIDVDGSLPGNYFVIYETTLPGCNGRDSIAITINDITADAGTDGVGCRFSYDLAGNTPATGATGEWSVLTTPSDSETATFANRFDPTTSVSVSDSGAYEFEWRVTQGGCSVADRMEVKFYHSLKVQQFSYTGVADCSSGPTGFAAMGAWGGSGSFTFAWSAGSVSSSVTLTPKSTYPPEGGYAEAVNTVPVGTHTLTVTDNVSGCDTVVVFTIGVVAIEDDLTSSGSTICAGASNGEITLSSTTNNNRTYAIEYLDEDDNPVSSAVVLDATTNPTVTTGGFAKGTYKLRIEVTASDDPAEVGCLTYRKVDINEHPAPVISLNTIGQPSCSGTTDGSISINVSGTVPGSYAWTSTNGDTYNTQNLSSIPAGDYTLEATYNGTCTETFGPVSVLPQNVSPGPTANTPLAPSIQCSRFDARWSNEGAGITYQLDVSEDVSFTTPLFLTQAVPANTTTFTVSGLAPGMQYFYRVRSVNGSCVSENSNVISVTTETGDVPSIQEATFTVCDQFTANWTAVPGATDYAVQVATDAAFTNVLTSYNPASVGSNDNKLLITGLTGGQTYHYRVTATTACGTSAYSAAASVTTDGLNDAPTNLSAVAGCATAELSWQAVSGSVSRYEVYLDDDNDFTNGTLSATPDATEVTATTTTVSGLTDGSPYFFYVLAILNGCNTTMAVSDFTTRSEPTPPAVSASDIKCDGFTLSWPAVPDADDYVVDISEDAFATFTTNTITDLSLEVGSLTPGTTYQYRVKAQGCVESAFTSGTVATDDTPGGLANAPTAAAPSCVGFTVNWTAQTGIRYFVEASPVGDNFTSVIERSPEVDGDSYTFTTLAVETDYNYRVIPINDCGEGSPTNGSSFISTKLADECGCGHDQVAFTVTTSNATCPGSADGAFTILSRKKAGVTVTPDMGRFKYRYQSLNNPADTSAWEPGEPGSPPLPHFFSGVKAGDYEVLVWDTLGLPGCVDTVAFTTTIGLQNEIRVTAKAETCDSLGQVVVDFPGACNTPDRYYWARIGSGEANGDDKRVTISGLSAGDYQVEIFNFFTNEPYDTLSVFVPNNCSTGTDTTTVCNLNGITFIPETTLAACDTGEGSVTFTAINNTTETFTFTVIEEGGVVFETKEGTSGITFENLPSRRYTYEIYDALSQSCRGKFTVGTKSVSFTATVPQTIACDDVTTSINVTVDTDATLAAGPYEVFLMDQTDTLMQTSLPLGSVTTTFADVAVGGSYEVVIVAAAEDACVARRTVDATPPGTTALQFTYQLDSATCFEETGSGFVTMSNIVVAEGTPFDAFVIDIATGERVQSRKFPITPESFTFAGLPSGQYQILLEQQQNGCEATLQTKRSETFVIDGPSSPLTPSIRSYVEVTVNYPYGTIEIDSIGNLMNGELLKEGAPYEVRIAADPNGASTDWVEVVNENPIVRPYRYEYLDQPVGTYFVEVRDRFGCVVQRQVEVGYTSELYIPNIFTPNSDGENDTFQILNLEDFGENAGVQLTITNRWGRQIYRAKNYTNAEAWDGGNYSDGVYFYHLILPDNTVHNGWVEIWRGRTP